MKRVLLISLLLAWVCVAHGEQRVALVIGNGAYQYASLQHPPQEADAISEVLTECGFRVIKRINCTHQEMEQAIRTFGREIRQGGIGLFYYGGHGVQVQGQNYLIPVDADIQGEEEAKFKAVDAEMVLGKMATAGNRVNIVILDACRNNPFGSRFKSSTRGLKKMDAPKGTLLAYSTAPGDVAEDGVYTPALVKHMKTPGLSVLQVFMNVRNEVMTETGDRQVPWEVTSLREDFFFVPGESTLSPIPRPETRSRPNNHQMILIPAGEFTMGTNFDFYNWEGMPKELRDFFGDLGKSERPEHQVFLDAFYIDKYEVTVAQYRACIEDGVCETPGTEQNCNWEKTSKENHPINCVNWYDAETYCKWAGLRLPTEAEWEKAARGTDKRIYPWGNYPPNCDYAVMMETGHIDSLINSGLTPDSLMTKERIEEQIVKFRKLREDHLGCVKGSTWPVGSKPKGTSPYGIMDMAGNVEEWVADWYAEDYYSQSPRRNPQGPSNGEIKVMRGGGMDGHDLILRALERSLSEPTRKSSATTGFRCARNP